MRSIIGSAMVIAMALCILSAVILYGAVTLDLLSYPMMFASLAFMLWGFKLFLARKVSWKQTPMVWPVLAFVAYAFARYWTSPLEFTSRVEFMHVLFYAGVFLLCANNFYHSRDRAVMIITCVILVVVESSYGIFQVVAQSDMVLFSERPEVYSGRGSGTYICPNHLAGMLEMVLGLLLGRTAFYHGSRRAREKGMVLKVLLIYVALMAVAGVLVTFSRAGYAAVIGALLALIAWGDWKQWRSNWVRTSLVAVLLVGFLVVTWKVPAILDRLDRNFIADQSGGGGALMWSATLGIIQAAPLLGTGPGTWQWMHQLFRDPYLQGHPEFAHSDVLQVYSDYGLVGGLLVVAFIACFFWQVVVLAHHKTPSEHRSFAIGAAIGVIAILIHSMVDFNLHIPANALLFVCLAGFTAGIDDPKSRFKRITLKGWPRYTLGTAVLAVTLVSAWKVSKVVIAEAEVGQGLGARAALEWDEAIDHFELAAALDPGNPEPHFQLGQLYLVQSEFRSGEDQQEERRELARQAVNAFGESLKLNSFRTQVYFRLAQAYQALGERENVIKTMDLAEEQDPNSASVHFMKGLIYEELGETNKAVESLLKSEMLNPGGDEVGRMSLQEIFPKRGVEE